MTVLDRVGSTNDAARHMAQEGAPHGHAVWARRQSEGRGRGSRTWISLPGNLFWSIILRPPPEGGNPLQLPHVVSLALCDWLRSLDAAPLAVKWPNDILLKGRKVAGMLLETAAIRRNTAPAWIIAGIGVNLRQAPKDDPALTYPATCLADHGIRAPLPQAARQLRRHVLARFEMWLDQGFPPLRHELESLLAHRGETIPFRPTSQKPVAARLIGIDQDGLLEAEIAGRIQRFAAGDILPASPAGREKRDS